MPSPKTTSRQGPGIASQAEAARHWQVAPATAKKICQARGIVDDDGEALAFGVATVDGLVSPAYVVARPIVPINPRFLDYFLRSDMFASMARRESSGITDFRLRLYWEKFRALEFDLPSMERQAAIARFLDAETARVA